MPDPLLLVLLGWLIVFAAMTALWFYQLRTGDSAIVDVAWASGVGLLALLYALRTTGDNRLRKALVMAVVLVWATRLSLYVWVRFRSMPDGRYDAMKEKWGERAQPRMFLFYQFQAVACLLFSLPMLAAILNPNPICWLDYLGVALGVLAIGGESLADWQLHRFRKNAANKGTVCREGLWNYSRHPNYFFEWLHWWAYVLFSISYPLGWLTILGPMAMLFFILRVTGIPPSEQQALKSRGDAYRDYQKTTNAFFPWFPKRSVQAQGS